jgi:hypothetical protein
MNAAAPLSPNNLANSGAIPAETSACRRPPWQTPAAPDDAKVTFTGFIDQAAAEKYEDRITLEELARMIAAPIEAEKSQLPWLILGRFGDQRSEKGCLRHKRNLLAITGIECDYDGKIDDSKTSFDDAVERLRRARIEAIAYTSPSHTTAAPRWRVLCPFASEYDPSERDRFLDRLNGVLGGVLEPESWSLSRAYYFGNVEGKPRVQVETITGMRLDLRPDLDAGAIGKGGADRTLRTEPRIAPEGLVECDDDPRLIAEAERRIARSAANGEGATETGNRTFALAAWLADMRTSDGLILSEVAILDLLMEHWPASCDRDTVGQTVANAIQHRGSDRGCELVLSIAEQMMGIGLDWDKPVQPNFRPLSDSTVDGKLNSEEGDRGAVAIALIRQMRGRGYTPNQVLHKFVSYPTSRLGDHYKTRGDDLRLDIARVFSEPMKIPVTIDIPDGLFTEIVERTFGSRS